MRSMFTMGIQHPSKKYLGFFTGFGQIASGLITAGAEIYKAHEQKEMQEDLLKFKEKQAAQAAAKEAEALRLQQESIKALQEQQAAAAGVPAAAGNTILGMQPGVFYAIAGVSVAAILGGALLLRGKK